MATKKTPAARGSEPDEREDNTAAAVTSGDEDLRALTLVQRIARIADEIGTITPTGWNPEQQYRYPSEADVLFVAKPLERKYGILLLPSIGHREGASTGRATKSGAYWMSTVIRYDIRVVNVDNPRDSLSFTWWGEAQDFSDKGVYKAMTSGLRHFRLKLYGIPTDDDVERVPRKKPAAGKPAAGRPAAAAAAGSAAEPRWRLEPASANSRKFATDLVRSSAIPEEHRPTIRRLINDPTTTGGRLSDAIDYMKRMIEAARAQPPEEAAQAPADDGPPTQEQRDKLGDLLDTRAFDGDEALQQQASAAYAGLVDVTYGTMEELLLQVGKLPEKAFEELLDDDEEAPSLPFV